MIFNLKKENLKKSWYKKLVKTKICLDYLKQDEKIKDFLKYTNKSEKSLNTHFSAYNKFFPYLINFFEIIENFNLEEYPSKKINESNEIKEEWIKNGVVKKTNEAWLKIDAEKKSNLFMKWANKNGEGDKKRKATYMNYVWRTQGLFTKIGINWSANPKTMEQINLIVLTYKRKLYLLMLVNCTIDLVQNIK